MSNIMSETNLGFMKFVLAIGIVFIGGGIAIFGLGIDIENVLFISEINLIEPKMQTTIEIDKIEIKEDSIRVVVFIEGEYHHWKANIEETNIDRAQISKDGPFHTYCNYKNRAGGDECKMFKYHLFEDAMLQIASGEYTMCVEAADSTGKPVSELFCQEFNTEVEVNKCETQINEKGMRTCKEV